MKKMNNKGFTLVETLCAIVMMILVTAIIVGGLQFTTNNFSKLMSVSEAQVMSKTLSTAIADELRYASDIKSDQYSNYKGDKVVTYKNTNYGSDNDTFDPFIDVDKEGHIVVIENDKIENSTKIVSDKVYTYGNTANVEISYSEEKCIFSVKLEIKNSNGDVLKTTNFDVEPIVHDQIVSKVSETDVEEPHMEEPV